MSIRQHGIVTGLAVAGAAFAGYPALRPYGPESGAGGAADFAGAAWLVSHSLAMAGFVLLALVLRAAAERSPWAWSGRPVRRAELAALLATALLLPYYGAETFGLRALGGYALEQGDPGVLAVADAFRLAPVAVTTFGVGLLLLGLVGVLLARGLWREGGLARVAGLLTGAGLVLFLPQFFTTPGLRVGHGLVLGAGLLLLAVATRSSSPADETSAAQPQPLGRRVEPGVL